MDITVNPNGPDSEPIGFLVRMFPKISETFVLEEVLGLERLGIPLRIYTLNAPTDAMTHTAVARVRAPVTAVPSLSEAPWRQFFVRHLQLFTSAPKRYLGALRSALRRDAAGFGDFLRAGWLAVQLKEDGIPHLHTHFISRPADMAELVAQLSGVPFSLSAHAKDIYLSDASDLRRKLEAAKFTVTCTEFNCHALRAIAPDAQISRMYHGIDHSLFHPAQRKVASAVPMILSVGRLREKKGLDTLIAASSVLRARGIPFSCEIVGYGEERDQLAAMIESHDLSGQIVLAGKLTRERVIERYARAAVFVQPSRVAADGDRDGIPNVLLEAMAMGVPVVATRVSGIPELVRHGTTGLLVEPDDPEALANAMGQLIDDQAGNGMWSTQLASAAREAVLRDFDNDRNLRVLLELLSGAHQCAPQFKFA